MNIGIHIQLNNYVNKIFYLKNNNTSLYLKYDCVQM